MSDYERPLGSNRVRIKGWLHLRLQGERAREDWNHLVEVAWSQLLQQHWTQLLSRSEAGAALDYYWNLDVVEAFSQSILSPALRSMVLDLRKENTRVDECSSKEVIKVLEDIVAAPKFVRDEWIEAFFREKAVEDVLSDSLYRALRDFSTIVPRLVLRNLPSGRFRALGLAGNFTEKLAVQLEKVIEPEIRSFLGTGSQKAIKRACDFAVEQLDSVASVQMRRNLIRFAAEQTFSFHLSGLSDSDCDKLIAVNEQQLVEACQNSIMRKFVNAYLDKIYQEHNQEILSEFLGSLAVALSAKLSLFARLTWPTVSALLAGPEVRNWFDGMVDEFLDEYEGSPGT